MELRSGYKETEVGVIPEDWNLAQLTDLVDKVRSIRYGIVQPGEYAPTGRLMVRGQDYSKGWVDQSELFRVSDHIEQRYKNARLMCGDLIITIVGAGTGYVEEVPEWLNGANLTQTTARIAIDTKKANARFCKYELQSNVGKRQVANYVKGAAQPGLNCGDVERFLIPLPRTSDEQRVIAAALSDVDALIASLGKLIAKKRDLKQAAMQQLLTGKTRLPGFRGEWEVKRLGDITDVDPENLGSDTRPEYTFNYISLEDVDSGTLNSHSELVFRTAPSRARRKLRKGDVLVSTVRPNLKSHFLFGSNEDHWVCSTGFAVIRCRERISDPGYIFFHMFGGRVSRQIDTMLTGSNYPAINSGDVRGLEIPFPEYNEQTAISAVLSDMDREIVALEQRLVKTRALKQGMMQELLTGRTRLV